MQAGMDEPSAVSTLGPQSSPETSQLEHLTSGQCTPLDTEMPLLNGVAVEMETLVPVIKVENDYYFDLQQTGPSGGLHSIAESILEVPYLALFLFLPPFLNRMPLHSITVAYPTQFINSVLRVRMC